MKILILGGTTFLGREITNALTRLGHQVSVFTHTQTPLPPDLSFHEKIFGERKKFTDLVKVARHAAWDVVIDNLAFDGLSVDLALAAFTQVKRYILTSTISVYRYSRFGSQQPYYEDFVDHDSRPTAERLTDAHWSYARGKLDAERQLIRQNQTEWTIFRPTMVYGPHDNKHRGNWYLARLLDGGPILLPEGGTKLFRLAYAPALAQLYALACENENSRGQIFNVAQSECVTLLDFVKDSAEALGVSAELVSVPTSQLGNEKLGGPLSMPVDWNVDSGKAARDLGFKHPAWDSFIRDTAHWFRDYGSDYKSSLLATRAAELTIAKSLPLI
jgi:nucleoside-diphosphate-sugar epimerase